MIKFLFLIIALIISFNILIQKDINKLPWLLCGILFFPNSINLGIPLINTISRLSILSLIISFLIKNKWYLKLKKFPFKFHLLILFISLILIGLNSERLSMLMKIIKPTIIFLEDFSLLFIAGFYIKTNKDVHFALKTYVNLIIVFSLYGVINYITKNNLYYEIIVNTFGGRDFASDAINNSRMRITSFSKLAHPYGMLLTLALIVKLFLLQKNKFNEKLNFSLKNIFIISLLLINLFLTNCRTPVASFFLEIFVIFILQIKKIIYLKLAFLLSILILVLISISPEIKEITSNTINVLTTDQDEIKGSSVSMRQEQLLFSLIEFEKNPIFGNGFYYIIEDLGFTEEINERSSDIEFRGFESYIYILLIEQGIIGILSNLIFFIGLFSYFIKKLRSSINSDIKNASIFSIGLLSGYILFILGTGELGTFPIFMVILGIFIRYIQINLNIKSSL